jgi:hypothetical protein
MMGKPGLCFLQEAKCSIEGMKSFSQKIWKGGAHVYSSRGFSGGLAILWDSQKIKLESEEDSLWWISCSFVLAVEEI